MINLLKHYQLMVTNEQYKRLYTFFARRGFKTIESEYSAKFFGNFYFVFSSSVFYVRAGIDRSIEFVEISSLEDEFTYFDLGLIRSFISGENELAEAQSIDILLQFIDSSLDDIKRIFSVERYDETKIKLEALRNERAKLMFPEWYK